MGAYNFLAFSSVMGQFAYSLGGGKGQRPETYPEFPLAFTEREKAAEEERKVQHTLEFFLKGQE